MTSTRRGVRLTLADTLMSVLAAAILIGVLVSVDVRVREHVGTFVSNAPGSSLAAVGAQAREVGTVLVLAVKTRSIEHAPLVLFVAVACLLVLSMTRT